MPKLARRRIEYGGAMIDELEIEAVNKVMRTGMAVGENVRSFEKRCAELMGHKYGVMVNSGSSALMLAMHLLRLPKGSEVITPTLTFSTDVASILHAGYVPVFAEVELDTYQIDVTKVEHLIGPKTRAMLVPNLVGGIPDWDALRAIADRHKLLLIEDSCDTLGARLRGRPPGARADISVTSFSIFHIITCLGNGGMVAVDDEKLWDEGLMLRCWGRSSEKYVHGTLRDRNDGRFLEDLDGIPYDGKFIFEDVAYGFIPTRPAPPSAMSSWTSWTASSNCATSAGGCTTPLCASIRTCSSRCASPTMSTQRGSTIPSSCGRNWDGAGASCRCTWKTTRSPRA